MKTKKWMCFVAALSVMMASSSCHDWGQMDPPAADDVYPTLENVAAYTFDEESLDPMVFKTGSYTGVDIPTLYADQEKGQVLYLNNGYITMNNPLTHVTAQNGVSLTFWMKQGKVVLPEATALADEGGEEVPEPQDLTGALIGFTNENNSGRLFFTANGWISYSGIDGEWSENDPAQYETGYITPGEWHYVALIVRNNGYGIYVDGQRKVDKIVTDFDCSKLFKFMNNVSTLYIGKGSDTDTAPWSIDDLKIYRNQISEKEIARPNMGGGSTGPGGDSGFEPVKPIYYNTFDADNSDVTIHGAGELKYVGGQWGTVYSNGMDGMRQNYLVLPSTVLSQSAETQALSIGVWVNRGNETAAGHYMWSPLISAYGAENTVDNSFPMFVGQYRGLLQTNAGGTWTDYTDAQNVAGANTVYHDATDWLADGDWHYYTAVITPTTAKVYFDGEIANEWELNGSEAGGSAAGLLSADNGLSWVCLGGNQAWNWGDPDPGFWFDDIAIYNVELSQETIKTIVNMKKDVFYGNTFSNGAGDATVVGAGTFINNDTPGFGKIFKNAIGGTRENYLKLPATNIGKVADSGEFTVTMWVNSTDAGDYYWNPLFTCYGDNGTGNPTMACQYRGVVAINTEVPDNTGAEFCDFGADLSDTGEVILYHGDRDWLADKSWHLYAATFTAEHVIVYLDGEVANSWTLDGTTRGQICNMQGFSRFTNLCVSGNQQWDWGDPDPGFGIDDVMLYDRVLTQGEIKQLMLWKIK